eukprot:6209622-Pleurochrysis_carterae.AAC.1
MSSENYKPRHFFDLRPRRRLEDILRQLETAVDDRWLASDRHGASEAAARAALPEPSRHTHAMTRAAEH